jgi:hypothetical protein
MPKQRRAALLSICAVAAAGTVFLTAAAYPSAVSLTDPHILSNFDLATEQQPENLALAPGGSEDLTFNYSREVGQVSASGSLKVLATLPQDSAGSALVSGIVRLGDGSLLVNYNAGGQSGIWRIPAAGGTPAQVVAIPDAGWLNGLALDSAQDALYASDSTLGAVWKVSLASDKVTEWTLGSALDPVGSGKGANGLKIHDGAVWVSNTAAGTLMQIPIEANGSAGPITTVATGVTGIDDFAFTGSGDVIAAQNTVSKVSVIDPATGTSSTALTSSAGLSNPTAIAVQGNEVYITSGAYFTRTDPNLLVATLKG